MNDFTVRELLENMSCTEVYFAWGDRKYMTDYCVKKFDNQGELTPWVRVIMVKMDDSCDSVYEVSGPSYEYCIDAFACAKIFDGKCVWEIEDELGFIDPF